MRQHEISILPNLEIVFGAWCRDLARDKFVYGKLMLQSIARVSPPAIGHAVRPPVLDYLGCDRGRVAHVERQEDGARRVRFHNVHQQISRAEQLAYSGG